MYAPGDLNDDEQKMLEIIRKLREKQHTDNSNERNQLLNMIRSSPSKVHSAFQNEHERYENNSAEAYQQSTADSIENAYTGGQSN